MVNQLDPDLQRRLLRNMLALDAVCARSIKSAQALLDGVRARRDEVRAMMLLTAAGDARTLKMVRAQQTSALMNVRPADLPRAVTSAAKRLARLEIDMQMMTIGQVFPAHVITQARQRCNEYRGGTGLHAALRDLLTDEVMAEIKQRTGQDNDRDYLAYALEYALSKED